MGGQTATDCAMDTFVGTSAELVPNSADSVPLPAAPGHCATAALSATSTPSSRRRRRKKTTGTIASQVTEASVGLGTPPDGDADTGTTPSYVTEASVGLGSPLDGDADTTDGIDMDAVANGVFAHLDAVSWHDAEICSQKGWDERPARNEAEDVDASTLVPWDPLGSDDDASCMQQSRLFLLLAYKAANAKPSKNLAAAWLFMSHLRKPLNRPVPSATVAELQTVMGVSTGSANNGCGEPSIPSLCNDAASTAPWDPLVASEATADERLQQHHARLLLLLSGVLARGKSTSQTLPAMWLQCYRTLQVQG